MSRGTPLNEAQLILCDGGWAVATDTRLMPQIAEGLKIGGTEWRQQATFEVISSSLTGREEMVKSLLEGLGGSQQPSYDEWVRTTEQVASCVQSGKIQASWDDFFASVLRVLPQDLTREPKRGTDDAFTSSRILPVQDGRLISADDAVRVFFQPVRGVDDTAELVDSVPDSLKERIAFIHSDIRTHEEGQTRRSTEVHKLLDGRFVRGFRKENILREVVLTAWPSMPVSLESLEAKLCAELLEWTFTLLGNEPSDELLKLVKNLPLACYGGWCAAQDASFGPGWSRAAGENLWELCQEIPSDAAERLRETLLLKPCDPRWGLDVSKRDRLFARLGVAEGFRLTRVADVYFNMASWNYNLPETAPDGVDDVSWENWRTSIKHEIRLRFTRSSSYSLERIYYLAELRHVSDLGLKGRRAFSSLVLNSMCRWSEGWETAIIQRQVPGSEWNQSITSPLNYLLRTMPWLSDGSDRIRPLSDRWYIPASYLRGQKERFRHLRPLTLEFSSRLERNDTLLTTLIELGLNVYPTDNKQTGPELLDALACAWREERVQPVGFDIFLGQLRHAWKHLDETEGLPRAYVVRIARRSFEVLDGLQGVYLPDESEKERALKVQNKPVLEMEVRDARRLADVLSETTGIRRASELEELNLIDGVEWPGDSDIAYRLEETRYDWLPTPLLAVLAHGGPNPTGDTTQTWKAAFDRLRNTRVVECQSIEILLMDGQETIAMSKPRARWLEGNVLTVTSEVNNSYLELTEAVQSLLDRQDLLKDLNLVFGALSGVDSPSREKLEGALHLAEIDAPTYADIHSRWAGNTGFMADRIRPVVMLLECEREGFEAAADDMDRLRDWLTENIPQWEISKLLAATRRSRDDNAMGLEAWRALGAEAQLPEWNAVLEQLGGEYEVVENIEVTEQTSIHLDEAQPLLAALARKIAIDYNKPDVFRKIEDVSQSFNAPNSWSKLWWKVPFKAVCEALHKHYLEIVNARHLKLIAQVSSIGDLQIALEDQGVKVDQDPYEIYRLNESQLKKVLNEANDLYRFWLEVNDIERKNSEFPQILELGNEAYLEQWSEAELWRVACTVIGDERFAEACSGHYDTEKLRNILGLDEKTLQEIQRKRAEKIKEIARKQSIIEIGGEPIEIGLIDYEKLLRQHTTRLAHPVGPHASKDEFTLLGNVVDPQSPSPNRRTTKAKIRIPRLSPEETEVVGIIGEMHAFRFLRKEFGGRSVRARAWVSESRLKVLPLVDGEPHEINDWTRL